MIANVGDENCVCNDELMFSYCCYDVTLSIMFDKPNLKLIKHLLSVVMCCF